MIRSCLSRLPAHAVALVLAVGCGGATSSASGAAPVGDGSAVAVFQATQSTAASVPASSEAAAVADVKRVNEPGQPVDLEAVIVPGKVTVVEFAAGWCEPCKAVQDKILAVMQGNERIALRTIDIGDSNDTPVAKQHQVTLVPRVLVFDDRGVLRYTLGGRDANRAAEIATHLSR